MSNDFVIKIDMVRVNEDGTIEIIDIPSWTEYPFTFQYKLYLTFEENLKSIFELLFSIPPKNYELSSRFKKYVENRKQFYEEVASKYLPIINGINHSNMSAKTKKNLIREIDLELNRHYPYGL